MRKLTNESNKIRLPLTSIILSLILLLHNILSSLQRRSDHLSNRYFQKLISPDFPQCETSRTPTEKEKKLTLCIRRIESCRKCRRWETRVRAYTTIRKFRWENLYKQRSGRIVRAKTKTRT